MNANWYDKIEEDVKHTGADGHIEKLNLRYWDFRFSNQCNLSCI